MLLLRRRLTRALALGLALPIPGRGETPPPLPTLPLRLVTGDLPPFAIEGQPGHPGVLIELVRELLHRCGHEVQIEFYPWARAMQMADNQPRVLILPLTRTPEREPHYQWLVRLYQQRFVFINRVGDAPVQSLEQARRLRLTVLRASPNLSQLLRHQFNPLQVVQAASVEDMLRSLERGHVDALFGSELINIDKLRVSGRDPARFQIGMMLEAGAVWLAAGGGVTAQERARLLEAYAAMQHEGTLERLFKSYGLKPRLEDTLR